LSGLLGRRDGVPDTWRMPITNMQPPEIELPQRQCSRLRPIAPGELKVAVAGLKSA
jgi:hypothetical protein